jgi:succinate dehydrogenase hydrophobic anchor subunit
VIIVAIKLIINKKVKSNIIEMIMFPATMVFLIFLFGYHFYALISNNLINSNGAFNKITSACIEFIFLFIFISFFFT